MSILDTLQAKVDAIDSDSTMSEILSLLHSVKDHPHKSVYDSAGLMPTDSAYLGGIAYSDYRDTMYVFTNIDSGWKLLDSDAATIVSSEPSSHIQGSTFGYSLGGIGGPTASNVIQKFSFTADENATDVADLTVGLRQHTSSYSSTDAFTHGGYTTAEIASVDKFNFASASNSTDFGDFPATGRYGGGNSSSTHGYQAGGSPTPNAFGNANNKIIKFPFAAGSLSTTTVGDLSAASPYNDANASETHGYHSSIGGGDNKIEKYSFTTDGNTTDVGDLLDAVSDGRGSTGLLSDISGGYGYQSTGAGSVSPYHITRYPFATDGNATDYCDFTFNNKWLVATCTSTTNGYFAGGLSTPGNNYLNDIAKFSYSSTANTVDVGDLLSSLGYNAGAAN